jgi:hypothetical protein
VTTTDDPDLWGIQIRIATLVNGDIQYVTPVIAVNTTTSGYQATPAITGLAGGGFVVTWSDGSQSGGDRIIVQGEFSKDVAAWQQEMSVSPRGPATTLDGWGAEMLKFTPPAPRQ